MPYEIPQRLQYEEKIIFGLTFRQLAYAAIFIVPALIIFLKTKLDLYLKIVISFALISLAAMFMFFNLQNYIKNMFSWMRFRKAGLMDKKMKEFLGIAKIEKGVLYVRR